MDTVKLEAKWPPDGRKCTIEASEFGIFKEPADGKRFRGTDRATGCLLVLSLLAAAAVVVYFMFFDYTMPSTSQAAPASGVSGGPIVSYAKYVKEKQQAAAAQHHAHSAENRSSTDGLLGAMLGVKNSANHSSPAEDSGAAADHDGAAVAAAATAGRHMRMYPPSRRPAAYSHVSYGGGADYWRAAAAAAKHKGSRLEYSDGMYGFNRRSDFPQLAAYRAPFPPKSVVDVMKYVTGPTRSNKGAAAVADGSSAATGTDYMVAQDSTPLQRYVPIVRPGAADEVNKFLQPAADLAAAAAVATPNKSGGGGNSKRFRNKFGPPVFLTPPRVSLPDDFMRPPDLGARYSTNFGGVVAALPPVDDAASAASSHHHHHDDDSAAHYYGGGSAPSSHYRGGSSVPSHTDVVYLDSPSHYNRYAVPDFPMVSSPSVVHAPKPAKKKRPKGAGNKKPISVMLDIYPMPSREHESEEAEDNEEENPEFPHSSLESSLRQSDVENLLLRLNLFQKLGEGARRLTKSMKKGEIEKPAVTFTTGNPAADEYEAENNNEHGKWFDEEELAQESRMFADAQRHMKKHK